jgi:uncharacterized protein
MGLRMGAGKRPAETMDEKYRGLLSCLQDLGSCTVAFSGGLDSTFLTAAAVEALGKKAVALTAVSDYMPKDEIDEARELAEQIGIEHRLIVIPFPELLRHNPRNRCYLCKKEIFSRILRESREMGIPHAVEGTNADDLQDDRPGLKALRELGVRSPLLESGFTKDDIRRHSKRLGLPTWDKPAYACLMTRLPFDEEVSRRKLERVEEAERYLRGLGIRALRVRSHGELARIEVAREERSRLFDEKLLDEVSQKLRALGFLYVTFDMDGYKTGSMAADKKGEPGEN